MDYKVFAKRLTEARKKAKLTQAELGQLAGMSQTGIAEIERGATKGSPRILALAKALGVSPQWLTGADENGPAAPPFLPDTMGSSIPWQSHGDLLPVMGTAEAGPDGVVEWNGDIIDRIPRPPFLANVSGAYAVFVVNDSMWPRYQPSEILYVNPRKPVTVGACAIIQIREGENPSPRALVKQLVKRGGKMTTLLQYNPRKEIDIPTEKIISMHRIVGSGEA